MQQLSFNLLETLHMLALLPCLFALAMLLFIGGLKLKILVPSLFFVALSTSFLLGLSGLIGLPRFGMMLFIWIESLQPALCFLLIMQLWLGRIPPPVYWLILCLPIIGGSSLVLASLQLDTICINRSYCLEAVELRSLYQLFAAGLIFLFLVVHIGRLPLTQAEHSSRYQSHRYWLMMTLVLAYAALMMVDLFTLTRHITQHQSDLIHVIMRLCLMYLVLTSLFRVFDRKGQQPASAAPKPIDAQVIQHIEQTLLEGKLYREMNFSREQFAKKLDLPEHLLSRAINQVMGKNFNEFINSYRIEEAKQRLVSESTSVTAIAFEVGFSSIASFNRVFKSMVGKSPTEYRQSEGA